MTRDRSGTGSVRRNRIGLSPIMVVALALLAVPRVVVHDLDIIHEGTLVNALFVFIPPLVWIAVAVLLRVRNLFLTLLVVGLVYGVFLAAGHQILWEANVGDNPPALGGTMSDLDPDVQTVIIRVFAAISSIVTGTIVGAASGLVAWGLAKVRG